jgi:hypothetical protein
MAGRRVVASAGLAIVGQWWSLDRTGWDGRVGCRARRRVSWLARDRATRRWEIEGLLD